MANLRITFDEKGVGRRALERNFQRDTERLKKAMAATADTVASRILTAGRQDIASAGNYGSKWTDGLKAVIDSQDSNKIVIRVTHDQPMFPFLLKGGQIRGNPLLWLPAPWATDAQKLGSPANYPGRLVQAESQSGIPILLLPRVIGAPAGSWQIKFLGFTSLRIPKKFHTLEIIREIAKQMPEIYKRIFGAE